MRTRWVPGHVRDGTTDYPGRYNAPWLETTAADSAIYVTHPFEDGFELDDWIELLWRVSQWTITWSMEFIGPTLYHEAHGVETSAVYSAATTQVISSGEEHKMGAGFYHQATRDIDPDNPDDRTVGFGMHDAGHKYYPAANGVAQKFRPAVSFEYANLLGESAGPAEPALYLRLAANSIPGGVSQPGIATLAIGSLDRTAQCYVATNNIAGPATTTCSVRIEATGWWAYAKPDGTLPIWDANTGAQLRDFRAAPSVEADGTILVPGGGVRRFVGR